MQSGKLVTSINYLFISVYKYLKEVVLHLINHPCLPAMWKYSKPLYLRFPEILLSAKTLFSVCYDGVWTTIYKKMPGWLIFARNS